MCFKYKELQIVKHALMYYAARDGATEKDIAAENRLLEKVTERVNEIKERYGI